MEGTILQGRPVIDPRQHGGPRDPAHVFAVEIGEAYSPFGKGIEMRGQDFPTEAPEVGVAHVVGHDQKNVGFFCEQGTKARQRAKDKKQDFGGHDQIPIAKEGAVKRRRKA